MRAPTPAMALLLAYGSLLADLPVVGPAVLPEHELDWGVAMDNARDVPGYKAYLDAEGRRPAVRVRFLDVLPAPGAAAAGGLLEVDEALLARLDVRERNYARRAVDARRPDGSRVAAWTYVGLPAARERARSGASVLVAGYVERVRGARAALGLPTPGPPPGVEVRDLTRIEL